MTTDNPRDRKLVTLAGILPDVDGLGMLADIAVQRCPAKEISFQYYQNYHHLLLHGWPGAIPVVAVLADLHATGSAWLTGGSVDVPFASAVRPAWVARAFAG